MTNYERVKNMSLKQLAKLLSLMRGGEYEDILKWLESEVAK